MEEEIVELKEDVSASPLYSADLAPVPKDKRTWSVWSLAALWVGMAVCIPTYLLASYMITTGLTWWEALIIIGLANLIITIPMVLNGHAGVKYGVPFPVIGRSSFGVKGIHIPSVIRGIVACGWFGVNTWLGGLAIYSIFIVVSGVDPGHGFTFGQFVCFGIFWLLNMVFIWKGTNSIKWLEEYSAPILIFMGLLLIGWGMNKAGGFSIVLDQSAQLEKPVALLYQTNDSTFISINPITDKEGVPKAESFRFIKNGDTLDWGPLKSSAVYIKDHHKNDEYEIQLRKEEIVSSVAEVVIKEDHNADSEIWPYFISIHPILDKEGVPKAESYRFIKNDDTLGWEPLKPSGVSIKDHNKDDRYELQLKKEEIVSSVAKVVIKEEGGAGSKIWSYLIWLTAMVGFWATMSLSIADITRYSSSQSDQVKGQFIGLPLTMMLYSFVGIFVTCAAVINFDDVLIANDAPWDPISLLAKFDNPWVVVISQLFMIVATLSTNIAANVIAPANAFSNLFPKHISFRMGGTITGVIGIIICPWLLLNEIQGLLIDVSAILGPVLAILVCDYFIIRKKEIQLADLYKENGIYSYGGSGINKIAIITLFIGAFVAIGGKWIDVMAPLYSISWFSGFIVSFTMYYFLMKNKI